MHPAYSVILFTTASGAGYGLLALLGLVGIMHGPVSNGWFGATALVIALGLITMGLMSSTFHLGHPERAWRAFSQWRTSWLSREGVAAVLTYVPAFLFSIAWLWPGWGVPGLGVWGILTAVMAAVTVYCTGMIYASLPTIRQWDHPLVVPVYMVFALATGATLLAAIAHVFGRGQPVQGLICVTALAAAMLLKLAYWRSIDADDGAHTMGDATGLGHLGTVRQWETPHTAENFVMKEMGYQVGRKHADKLRLWVLAALAVSMTCALAAMLAGGAFAVPLSIAAAAAALFGAVIERWLFFAEAQHVVTLYYGAARA